MQILGRHNPDEKRYFYCNKKMMRGRQKKGERIELRSKIFYYICMIITYN